ncbi:GNAT family N-acetyltransferase [Fundidesulfovibrio soli]|uniref:GNAT family N-acetyltransferase n=1 Tax=Fundidesulfovibrio soli TaxID=2922716 RepID=UPI001FAF572B|nr:GNAT family N-acetyltransferase [Fundidesulfovibrio soli]
MTGRSGLRIEKLHPGLDCRAFDCGKPELNRFLQSFALMNQKANSAQTYAAHRDGVVVGYYSLAVGAVEHQDAPARVGKGLARHPIPVMILARLAVHLGEQRAGIGSGLLKDALLRTAAAAKIAGIRAVLVHAKDASATEFYKRYDFEPCPFAPNKLMLLMKDLERLVE